MKQYETVIGLEVHVELATKTKIFCGCSTEFGGAPNTHTCPVCTGMPGSLPVLNKQVVEYAMAVGLATNCKITQYCKFDRKNYFYPDNPQNCKFCKIWFYDNAGHWKLFHVAELLRRTKPQNHSFCHLRSAITVIIMIMLLRQGFYSLRSVEFLALP